MTYKRRGVWHLGNGRRKQNDDFLSVLAKPLLTTLAGVAGLLLLNFATKKYSVEQKEEEKEDDAKNIKIPETTVC